MTKPFEAFVEIDSRNAIRTSRIIEPSLRDLRACICRGHLLMTFHAHVHVVALFSSKPIPSNLDRHHLVSRLGGR